MSEALFTQTANGRHTATSAGTTPAEQVHPEVIEVMQELNINLTDRKPQKLSDELAEQADVIVTMGCGDQCPYIPGKRYIDWQLQDPKGQSLEDVRKVRDQITKLTRELASNAQL